MLSPEEQKQVILQFKELPYQRKKVIQQLIQHPCSYCEKEFNIPNVGWSHGICNRHKIEAYKEMGLTVGPSPNNHTVDLKDLSPEEIKLAVKLFSIVYNKKKR